MRKYSASDIAKWFLYYNNLMMQEFDGDYISNLKLQKLLYYAQGSFLAIKNEELFADPILAWAHGPVVESVYREYKIFKSNGITCEIGYKVGDIDGSDEELLIKVYNVFAKYSALGLRSMTHQESPWRTTQQNCEIKKEKIKEYFKETYVA